jgi:hypothetical protein
LFISKTDESLFSRLMVRDASSQGYQPSRFRQQDFFHFKEHLDIPNVIVWLLEHLILMIHPSEICLKERRNGFCRSSAIHHLQSGWYPSKIVFFQGVVYVQLSSVEAFEELNR